MHIYLTLLTIAVFYTVFPSTTSAQIAGPKGDLIVVGKIDTIHSVILGEDRAIWVSVFHYRRPGKVEQCAAPWQDTQRKNVQ